MQKVHIISLVVLLGLALAACSASTNPTPSAPAASTSGDTAPVGSDLTQTKEEASVTVTVTPLNLADPSAATLDFEVSLDTHSVDLAYNLMSIAILRSDAGEEVQPTKWNGPGGGGHHMSGTLSFPQMQDRGQSLTLILRGVANVPERAFEWNMDGSK